MKAPKSLKQAQDILFVPGNITLDHDNIQAIINDYCPEDGQIRSIQFDGMGRLGAWVNASVLDSNGETFEYQWLYIAAGDHDNRMMIAQAG